MFKNLKRKIMGYDLPDVEVAQQVLANNKLTPDIWKLEQLQCQLIFIADDLMQNHRNHSMIAERSLSGDDPLYPEAFTQDKFTFFKKDLGTESYPIAIEEGIEVGGFMRFRPNPARIKGELYAVRPSLFIELDKHKQNGLQFTRKRVPITVPSWQIRWSKERPVPRVVEFIHQIQAWMYVGNPMYWDDLIGGVLPSSPVEMYRDNTKPWLNTYYKFTNEVSSRDDC